MISDELRDLGKTECKIIKKNGKNPGSVMLEYIKENDDTAQLMFVPTDKYITITASRAEEQEAYGEDIVEEKTTSLLITK
jgi:hypothetical protein